MQRPIENFVEIFIIQNIKQLTQSEYMSFCAGLKQDESCIYFKFQQARQNHHELEALRERRPPRPRQIIILILPTNPKSSRLILSGP